MNSYRILFIIIAISVLASCDYANDPERLAVQIEAQAEADRTAALTAQDVADREAARQLQEQQNAITAREADVRQARLTNGLTVLLYGMIGAGVLLAIGIAFAGSVFMVGRSVTSAINGAVNATTIKLDPVTRQYPLLYGYSGKGRFSLVNPNTGQVYLLDRGVKPDALAVRASNLVQLGGVIAAAAAKSNDPASIAIIKPPQLIEAEKVSKEA